MRDRMSLHEGSSVLDLKGDNYFSCAVGRKRSSARYLLKSSDDIVTLLKELAEGREPMPLDSEGGAMPLYSEGGAMPLNSESGEQSAEII